MHRDECFWSHSLDELFDLIAAEVPGSVVQDLTLGDKLE